MRNATIKGARIRQDDHGTLSASLDLDYGGTGQHFGGFALYLPPGFRHHRLESVAGHFIWRCMDVAGVTEWDQLKGKAIRVIQSHTNVLAIGHITIDDWFEPEVDFEDLRR